MNLVRSVCLRLVLISPASCTNLSIHSSFSLTFGSVLFLFAPSLALAVYVRHHPLFRRRCTTPRRLVSSPFSVCGITIGMVLHMPFVRWDKIVHDSDGFARAGIYYLETAWGERVFCAVAIPCEGNHMRYKPVDNFLQDYRAVLPSGRAVEWNFRFQLASWLDGIMYYSFLRYSEEGIGDCWHFTCVSPTNVAQRLPLGLRRYILPSGSATWILVVHGYRIWPIEVID